MVRYLEVFYRHRLLLIAPILIALLASVGFAVSRPRVYEATAQLWFDPLTSTQAAQLNGYVSPADQAQGELKELLKTRSFCSLVGRNGPLAGALLSGNGPNDPLTRIVNLMRGVPSSAAGSNPQVLDDILFDTINRFTAVTSSGPQIVVISFDYSDPQVAAGTARTMVSQFSDELLSLRRSQAQGQLDFYTAQLQDQQAVVATADTAVNAYLQAHPDQRIPGALEDTQLTQLRRADDLDRAHYQNLVQLVDAAKLDIAATNQAGAAGFRVIDTPTVPYRAKGFVKSAALAAAGGLAAGLFLSLAGLLLLTAMDNSLHRPQEMPEDLSRRVVGSVPRLR